MNDDYLQTPSYTLYLASTDRVSGNNNSAIFNVNWSSFLPRKYDQYKIRYSFATAVGSYVDSATSNFSNCYIVANFQGQSLTYSTATSGSSSVIGYAKRDSTGKYFSSNLIDNPPKTISTPTQNSLTVQIYNPNQQNSVYNQPLVDTNSTGTTLSSDMSMWAMVVEFIPISKSLHK